MRRALVLLAALAGACGRDAAPSAPVPTAPAPAPSPAPAPPSPHGIPEPIAAMTEPTLFIRWGTGPDEATPRLSDSAAGGLQVDRQVRRQIAPLRLRLDPAGGYHVHSPGDGAVLAFDPQGRFVAKVALAGDVVDLAVTADRYVALVDEGRGRAVLAIGRDQPSGWRAEVDDGVDRLVAAGDAIFLSRSLAPTALDELDAATGAKRGTRALGHDAIDPVAAPDGTIVAATYFDSARRRGVLVFDPASGRTAVAAADAELYGTLLGAIGATAAHELVVYGPTRSDAAAAIFTLGPDAAVRARLTPGPIAAPPGPPAAALAGTAPVITGLQPRTTWALAADGRVLAVVTSEAGVAVIAVRAP